MRGRRQPQLRVISGIPAASAPILSLVLILAAIAGMAGLPRGAEPESRPAPAVVEQRFRTSGEDREGRKLPFTVYVLSQRLSWKLESVEELEGPQTLLDAEMVDAVNGAQEVYCVGEASNEGTRRREEERAGQRARKLAEWVRGAIPGEGGSKVFSLNAGQYQGPVEVPSSHQRKAIVIATGAHDEAVDLAEGLRSGLERIRDSSPAVSNLLQYYSRSKKLFVFPAKERMAEGAGGGKKGVPHPTRTRRRGAGRGA